MVLSPEFPFPKCSTAGSAATQLSGIRNHPLQLLRVEILDHSSRCSKFYVEELLGDTLLSQQLLWGGQVSLKLCEAYNKSEDCQILAGSCELSPHFTHRFHTCNPPFFSLCPHGRALGPLSQIKTKRRKRLQLCYCYQEVHSATNFLNIVEMQKVSFLPLMPSLIPMGSLMHWARSRWLCSAVLVFSPGHLIPMAGVGTEPRKMED